MCTCSRWQRSCPWLQWRCARPCSAPDTTSPNSSGLNSPPSSPTRNPTTLRPSSVRTYTYSFEVEKISYNPSNTRKHDTQRPQVSASKQQHQLPHDRRTSASRPHNAARWRENGRVLANHRRGERRPRAPFAQPPFPPANRY